MRTEKVETVNLLLFGGVLVQRGAENSGSSSWGAWGSREMEEIAMYLCANESNVQHHPLLRLPLQWLSHLFSYVCILQSFLQKPLRVVLLNHKPNNVMLSSYHTLDKTQRLYHDLSDSAWLTLLPHLLLLIPSDTQLQPRQPPCFSSDAPSILLAQGFALAVPSAGTLPHILAGLASAPNVTSSVLV